MEGDERYWTPASSLVIQRRRSDVAKTENDTVSDALDLEDVQHATFQLAQKTTAKSSSSRGPFQISALGPLQTSPKKQQASSGSLGTRSKNNAAGVQDSLSPSGSMQLAGSGSGGPRKSMAALDSDLRKSLSMQAGELTGELAQTLGSQRKSIAAGMVDSPTGSMGLEERRRSVAQRRSTTVVKPWELAAAVNANAEADGKPADMMRRRSSVSGWRIPDRRGSVWGGRKKSVFHAGMTSDFVKMMRPKVNILMEECMETANQRLTEKNNRTAAMFQAGVTASSLCPILPTRECLAPLRWLPMLRQDVILEGVYPAGTMGLHLRKRSALLTFGRVEIPIGEGFSKFDGSDSERDPNGGSREGDGLKEGDRYDPEVLRMTFQEAFNEAKQAQKQAEHARAEVDRLKGVLATMQKKQQQSTPPSSPQNRLGKPTAAKSPRQAPPTEEPEEVQQLQALEARLTAELQVVLNENQQLEYELNRPSRRRVGQLQSEKVLPQIAGGGPSPRSPMPRRETTPRTPRTPRRVGGPPPMASTMTALPSLANTG